MYLFCSKQEYNLDDIKYKPEASGDNDDDGDENDDGGVDIGDGGGGWIGADGPGGTGAGEACSVGIGGHDGNGELYGGCEDKEMKRHRRKLKSSHCSIDRKDSEVKLLKSYRNTQHKTIYSSTAVSNSYRINFRAARGTF